MSEQAAIQLVVDALYMLISGPGSQPRDWAAQRALFMPQAHMVRTVLDAEGQPRPEVIALADYAANYEAKMAGRDFYEVGLRCRIEQFGNIAHAFSSYVAYADLGRRQQLKRGINSIQLYRVDGQWKVAAMVWDDERPGLAIPDRYLPPGEAAAGS